MGECSKGVGVHSRCRIKYLNKIGLGTGTSVADIPACFCGGIDREKEVLRPTLKSVPTRLTCAMRTINLLCILFLRSNTII